MLRILAAARRRAAVTCASCAWLCVDGFAGKISRTEWREWARQKREMMQRFNSEKEALIADNKRLRASQDPSVGKAF